MSAFSGEGACDGTGTVDSTSLSTSETRVSEAAVLGVRSRPVHFRFASGHTGRRGAAHMFTLRASQSRQRRKHPRVLHTS